jgi:hypothetical protein
MRVPAPLPALAPDLRRKRSDDRQPDSRCEGRVRRRVRQHRNAEVRCDGDHKAAEIGWKPTQYLVSVSVSVSSVLKPAGPEKAADMISAPTLRDPADSTTHGHSAAARTVLSFMHEDQCS